MNYGKNFDLLPETVKTIINSFDSSADPVKECERINSELEKWGLEMPYDLGGEPGPVKSIRDFFIPTEENKYHVDDYPYGYSERCEMFYYFEFDKKGRVRWCRQSLYEGRYNKPKKSTYSAIGLAFLNDEDHVKWTGVHDKYRPDVYALYIFRLAEIGNLPPAYQKLVDDERGLTVEEKEPYSFGKVDSSYSPDFNVVKLTFDADSVGKRRIFEAVEAYPDKGIFDNGGGFRVFLRSQCVGYFTGKHYESYKSAFAADLDPFAEEEKSEEGVLRLFKPIKKQLPVQSTPGVREFDRKHLYTMASRWLGGGDITLRFLSDPKRDYRHRYKFTNNNTRGTEGSYFTYPVINEAGKLVDQRPKSGFVLITEEGNYFSGRWKKSLSVFHDIHKAYVFNSEGDAARFCADFDFQANVKPYNDER